MTRRAGVLCSLLAGSAVLFAALFFTCPEARQKFVFPYTSYCDYRVFMLPCMESGINYSPNKINRFDACYPPIAYYLASSLSTDKGISWLPQKREWLYLASIALMEILGLGLILGTLPGKRLLAFGAVVLSPAVISSVLRGNPSGWAFALVALFLCAYRSPDARWRAVAALSLALAVALKLTPVLFGLMYLAENPLKPAKWPWRQIALAAVAAAVLLLLPFAGCGGFEAMGRWFANALENSRHYSMQDPIWGFVALVNRFDPSLEIPRLTNAAIVLTNLAAASMAALALAAKSAYARLAAIGIAMALFTHHDYGAAYLLPAFAAFLADESFRDRPEARVVTLLECVAWFIVLTPLQIPHPAGGSLNFALQGEALLLLAAAVVIRIRAPL